MKKLTKKEEEIMQVIWHLGKAFIKEIVDELPEPKPHYNTVSTMVKILEEKEFVKHEKYGNMYRYQPLVPKETYQGEVVDDVLEKYFDNSYINMIAHFAKKENMSEREVNEIIQLIKSNQS